MPRNKMNRSSTKTVGTNRQERNAGQSKEREAPKKVQSDLLEDGTVRFNGPSHTRKRPHHDENDGASSAHKRAKANDISNRNRHHSAEGPSPKKVSHGNEIESFSHHPHPSKRSKIDDCNEGGSSNHSHLTHHKITKLPEMMTQSATNNSSNIIGDMPAAELPAEFRHFAQQYNFKNMSIISSSKLESKIRTLLQHVSSFDFADTKTKPGVAILSAKASVASKLCSIVEIAKKAIIQEKGTWWQYNKLHGEFMQLKTKQPKRVGGGKTLSEWHQEQAQSGQEEVRRTNDSNDSLAKGQRQETINDEDTEMEDAFETMEPSKDCTSRPTEQNNELSGKIRNTPIMTIYFARVSVPGLKELYG